MPKLLAGLIISYLLGSIPTAYVFAKYLKNIDLRKHGSGNLGATNAFRVLGKGIGTTVLLLDILKGTIAVLLANSFFYDTGRWLSANIYISACAAAAVCGHNWTIFLKFKGGKGVATSLGALVGFSIIIPGMAGLLLLTLFSWIIIFLFSGFVSLASIICSLLLPVFSYILKLPNEITLLLGLLGAFSVLRHKLNIKRLLQNKENRFNTKNLFKILKKKTLS